MKTPELNNGKLMIDGKELSKKHLKPKEISEKGKMDDNYVPEFSKQNQGKENRRKNPMDNKSRELTTVIKEDGTVDMVLGGIVTGDRDLTNKADYEISKDGIKKTAEYNKKNKLTD